MVGPSANVEEGCHKEEKCEVKWVWCSRAKCQGGGYSWARGI